MGELGDSEPLLAASEDHGWRPDLEPVFGKTKGAASSIGALAVSESDANIIYVGTEKRAWEALVGTRLAADNPFKSRQRVCAAFAIRRMAAKLWSTSASVVAQFDTLIRIAV